MTGDDQVFEKVGDDMLTGADGGETLDNGTADDGAGNDSLYFGSRDIAIKDVGEDSFVTGDWVEDSEPPVIIDFATTQDQLVVMYDPGDATAPDLAITSAAEGDLLVSLSGQTIARLIGDTTGFSLDNISLVAM